MHFANVGKATYECTQNTLQGENMSAPHNVNVPIESDYFRPQPVDTNTVILTVKDLKQTNSVGSDDIQLKFVRDALYVIAFYLTCIINTSIVTGVFPTAWKHAIVVSIYKNGDAEQINNYRPISLLPVISKTLEKNSCKSVNVLLRKKNLTQQPAWFQTQVVH